MAGRRLAALLLLALAACTPPAGPVAGGNAVAAAAVNAPVAPPPPPPPEPARVTSAAAWAAGVSTPLAARGETTVEPSAQFRVELPGRVPDARLTLLDQGEALVAGAGERSIGAETGLAFRPEAPLLPGARYRLRLDGEATREFHPEGGAAALPVEWVLLVAGSPPAEKAKPGRKKKR